MRDGSPTTEDTKSAGTSPLRLCVGVFLILLWIVPYWALAPRLAYSLSGAQQPAVSCRCHNNHRRRADHHRLLGFWVAGAAVKSIIKGSTMRHALVVIWFMLIHGDIRGQGDVGDDPNEERPPRKNA